MSKSPISAGIRDISPLNHGMQIGNFIIYNTEANTFKDTIYVANNCPRTY